MDEDNASLLVQTIKDSRLLAVHSEVQGTKRAEEGDIFSIKLAGAGGGV